MQTPVIPTGGASAEDRRSLVALQAALTERCQLRYLELGCYLGATLQSFVADSRCQSITAIDRRDAVSADVRGTVRYEGNTTAHMLELLEQVPGADLGKLQTVDASTDDLDPSDYTADLCFIDAEHTNSAVLRDARFCRRVLRDRGVIAFHDRTLVGDGIREFLSELSRYRAYPLAHDLFVVEINVPSLLSDPSVKAQVPHNAWLVADRLRAIRPALWLGPIVRRLQARMLQR